MSGEHKVWTVATFVASKLSLIDPVINFVLVMVSIIQVEEAILPYDNETYALFDLYRSNKNIYNNVKIEQTFS